MPTTQSIQEISVEVPPPSEHRAGNFLPPWLYNIMNRLGLIELLLVHKWNFMYGVVGFTTLYLVHEYFMTVTCNIVGFILPAIKSVKAIESPSKDDDTEWLMYWVVFAAFSVIEFFSDILLSWFPLYFLGKCFFLLWCMSPVSWNGSSFLYKKFIRRLVLSNELEIDRVISRVNAGARDIIDTAKSEMIDRATASMMHAQREVPESTHSISPVSKVSLRKSAASKASMFREPSVHSVDRKDSSVDGEPEEEDPSPKED